MSHSLASVLSGPGAAATADAGDRPMLPLTGMRGAIARNMSAGWACRGWRIRSRWT